MTLKLQYSMGSYVLVLDIMTLTTRLLFWGGDDNQSLQGFIQGNPIDIYVYHYLFNQWC